MAWKRRITRQLKGLGYWEYVDSSVTTPVFVEMGDKIQNEFQDRLKHYNRELNKVIYILENTIYEDIFDIFRSYSYDNENSDPKVLVDILIEVFTKNTIGSIQSMKKELFTMNTEDFDNLQVYLNCIIYLQ